MTERSYPTITLGGVPISGPILEWPQTAGIEPTQAQVRVHESRLGQIETMLGTPQVLTIAERAIQRVYPLLILPGSDPFHASVLISDFRWLWTFPTINRRFNAKRATGDRLQFADGKGLEPADFAAVSLDLEYVRHTLYPIDAPATLWTPRLVLDHVLQSLGETGYDLGDNHPSTEVEDLTLADQGHVALARVLSLYYRGFNVVPTDAGTIRVTNALDRSEVEVYERIKDKQRQEGVYAGPVDRRAVRPRRVRVHFNVEAEVRFDYSETGSRVNDTAQLVNCARVTDPSGLTINGQKVGPGSWVAQETLFSAWGGFGWYGRTLSFAILRRHLAGDWRQIVHEFSRESSGRPNANYAARFASVSGSFREHYQIDEQFMSRLQAVYPRRVGVLNTATMTRAQAPIYTDWMRRPSELGFQRASMGVDEDAVGWFFEGYADRLEDAFQAPGDVSLVDPSGVIHVRPRQKDLYGRVDATVWGIPLNNEFPSQDLGKANRTAVEAHGVWQNVTLSPTFELATILTCVPGSPNDERRFYSVDVDPSDAYPLLGADQVPPCTGPELEIRLLGIVPARFAYTDDTGGDNERAIRGEAAWNDLEPVNEQQLADVARAAAAAIYAPLADGIAGTAIVSHDPTITLTGAIHSVSTIVSGGAVRTRIDFGLQRPEPDLWRFMPESTRRALLNTLQGARIAEQI